MRRVYFWYGCLIMDRSRFDLKWNSNRAHQSKRKTDDSPRVAQIKSTSTSSSRTQKLLEKTRTYSKPESHTLVSPQNGTSTSQQREQFTYRSKHDNLNRHRRRNSDTIALVINSGIQNSSAIHQLAVPISTPTRRPSALQTSIYIHSHILRHLYPSGSRPLLFALLHNFFHVTNTLPKP